jgi:hypothetical protein
VCVRYGGGEVGAQRGRVGGDTYKHLRTEPLLGEGHWKDAAMSSKVDKVYLADKAWAILSDRGANVRAWMHYLKWRGACGKASGKRVPRPAPAQKFEANHVACFPGGGKGKGKRVRCMSEG